MLGRKEIESDELVQGVEKADCDLREFGQVWAAWVAGGAKRRHYEEPAEG